MAHSSSSTAVVRRVVDDIIMFNGETELRRLGLEIEAMPYRLEVYDSLQYLKESKEAKNNKLACLSDLMAQTDEVISMKEGHVKMIEEAIRFV
nr:hypothetical protein [Tanacetum cinerariifolium]